MPELSRAGFELAVLGAGLLLYAIIWIATRRLSRVGKVLARLAPLGLVIPLMIYLASTLPAPRMGMEAPTASKPGPREYQAERSGGGSGREATDRTARAPEPPPPPTPPPAERPPAMQPAPAAPPQVEAAPPRAPDSAPPPVAASPPPPMTGPASEPPATRGVPAPTARSARPAGPPPGVPAEPQGEWDIVPVFYGTDRVKKEEVKRIVYTPERGRRLELGRALVTVPRTHQVPKIERPFAIRVPFTNVMIYEQAEDPKVHFTIRELKALTHEEFLALVRERIGGSTSFKDQAVVFVHGYNTSFDYALYRTAQMAYDLKFDGAAFLYSWPAGGGVSAYVYDRESSEQAEPYLRQYLEMVLKETGAKSVSVIAHSMGNMPLLRVLQSLGPTLPPGVQLNQIILAAPDVDRNLFENLAGNIKAYGRGVTLYCSSNDRAMAAARRVAGGIARAGDIPAEGPIVLAGIDTIDVSQTSTDYLALNHSSYADKSALLDDISQLLQTGMRPPEKRTPSLLRINTAKGDFWRYPSVTR